MENTEQNNQIPTEQNDPNPNVAWGDAPTDNQTPPDNKKNNNMLLIIVASIVVLMLFGGFLYFMMAPGTNTNTEPIPTILPTEAISAPSPTDIVDEIEAVDVEDTTPTEFEEIEQDLQNL